VPPVDEPAVMRRSRHRQRIEMHLGVILVKLGRERMVTVESNRRFRYELRACQAASPFRSLGGPISTSADT